MRDWYNLLVLKIDCFGLTTFGHHAMPFAQPPLKLHSAAITSHALVTRDKRAVSATCLGETKDAASIQLALFDPLRAHN